MNNFYLFGSVNYHKSLTITVYGRYIPYILITNV